ncbi:MAG: hypothetical protein LBJ97_01820 [Mycoplasmataceae bacterium]|jgi:hypothetical protein|nr:hypothetical protein [Mycoplasmataceae bacterium]
MKIKEHITITEIIQKLEVVQIQLKLLFESYRDFVTRFLSWEIDDPNKRNLVQKNTLTQDFKRIMDTLLSYSREIEEYVKVVDEIVKNVEKTKSTSMIKSTEHNLIKIDNVLLHCNTYIFLIDESQHHISTTLDYAKSNKKRLLN